MSSQLTEGISTDRSFGRRTFLKGTAATLGIAALTATGCAPQDEISKSDKPQEAPEEQFFSGVCRGNCFGGCALKIKVREGKVVATTAAEVPDERYRHICQKGHSHLHRIYDPNRVKTPLRRVGERGSGEWEEITWDEAVQEITTKWKQYQAESGNESIAFLSGAGNQGLSAVQYTGRLRKLMGGTTINSCYDGAYFYGNGRAEGVGEGYNTNEITDLLNAKSIFLWGTNPSEAQPRNWHFIMDAKAAGAKLVCIDPNWTVTASRSDLHVPLRPGTDNALIMAMMNVIVENNWIDVDFIKKGTVGPFLVKESDGKFLRQSDLGLAPAGKDDKFIVRDADGNIGTPDEISDPVIEGSFEIEGHAVTCAYTLLIEAISPWTVQRASELCDVPEDTIRELAEIYTQNAPSSIYQGFGPDHYVNGHEVYFTLCAMAAISGNLSKLGASCGYCWEYGGYMNFVKTTKMDPDPSLVKPSRVIPSGRLNDAVNNKELAGKPINLRSLYIWCGNPVGNQTERQSWLDTFSKLDLIVVTDMMLGDTAMYADIVLPVTHWFELNEIMPQTSAYLLLQEKAIDPLYEAKTDVEIINMIGNAMGFEGQFEYTNEEYLADALDNPSAQSKGVTWEKLKEEKIIRAYSADPYIHAENGVFPTPTKREQFYQEAPTPYVDYGQQIDVEKERLPYWEPPFEAWPETVGGFEATEASKKYPIIFNTERNKMKVHTMWGRAPWLLELYPEPVIRINPVDADPRGIKDGDYVRAFNDRGEAVFKAQINPGIRPGMVVAPKGWEKDQFQKGHYSDLTSRVFNEACPNNCYFDALIEIEKA